MTTRTGRPTFVPLKKGRHLLGFYGEGKPLHSEEVLIAGNHVLIDFRPPRRFCGSGESVWRVSSFELDAGGQSQ